MKHHQKTTDRVSDKQVISGGSKTSPLCRSHPSSIYLDKYVVCVLDTRCMKADLSAGQASDRSDINVCERKANPRCRVFTGASGVGPGSDWSETSALLRSLALA